jgi:HK97 family phage major capsid protein
MIATDQGKRPSAKYSNLGLDRDTQEFLDGEPPGTLYRAWRERMEEQLPGKRCPTTGNIIQMAIGARTCFETSKRNYLMNYLTRTGVGFTGSGPGGYGMTLPTGMSEFVFDRARTTQGPWSRCNWRAITEREWLMPAVAETARTNGNRWGGIQAYWGVGEASPTPSTQPSVASIRFTPHDLRIYTPGISRDLWDDAVKIQLWFEYVAQSEMRFQIENGMINGPGAGITTGGAPTVPPIGSVVGPQGVVNAACTVVVAKQSGQSVSTIQAINIDQMWSAIAAGSKENAVWHCNDDTLQYIDQLAVSGQFPEGLYFPRGYFGNQYATLKGANIIPSECCPVIGNVGDLICVDWSDYYLTYIRPKSTASPMFEIMIPSDLPHRGAVGMPPGSVESRFTDQQFFTTDALAFLWKVRIDGHFLWNSTVTNVNGAIVGPAAVLAAR